MAATALTFDSQHEDMIHDAQMDYYGKRLATCSSDRTIRLFNVDGETQTLVDTLKGHDGPVWQVAWAHPVFGNLLASCSYDGRVFIWKETNGVWSKIHEHVKHTASVNSIAWAPHEHGLILACASSDGKISILSYREDGTWDDSIVVVAHAIGCNAVTWAPSVQPGSLVSGSPVEVNTKRFASAGCDHLIKIWEWSEDTKTYDAVHTLSGHVDWVRDVAWAPNIGLPCNYIASCGQDKEVYIWTQDSPLSDWTKRKLKEDKFPDVVWRASWSLSGNILAVSCGNNKVSLWKENLDGDWECINELTEESGVGISGYQAGQ
ncbi:WD40 repeat-like protein [Paraphysoderma sedebokerense]|nr:WD40 repeat-like protein [Paraphysoderma sedebokerense]